MNITDRLKQLLNERKSPIPQAHKEQEIRNQIEELDRQAVAFNEAIGLLRAGLTLSNQHELKRRQQLSQLKSLQEKLTPSENTTLLLTLTETLTQETLQREFLNTHLLRKLYQQILEAKRRFLRHWYEQLNRDIEQLPTTKQRPLKTLLENCFQGALTVGVEQVEADYEKELLQIEHNANFALSPLHTDKNNLSSDKLLDKLLSQLNSKSPHSP